MDLRQLLGVLRRRPLLVALAAAFAAGAVLFAGSTVAADYEARTLLRLRTPGSITGDVVRTDAPEYLDRLQNTYARLVATDAVQDRVARAVGGDETPAITVELDRNSEILSVRAAGRDAEATATAANTAATALLDTLAAQDAATLTAADAEFSEATDTQLATVIELQARIDQASAAGASATMRESIPRLREELASARATADRLRSDYLDWRRQVLERSNLLSVVDQADVPTSPDRTSLPFTLTVAAVAAVLAAIGVAAVAENLRTTVDDGDEAAAATGVPLLGAIALRGDVNVAVTRFARSVAGMRLATSSALTRVPSGRTTIRSGDIVAPTLLVAAPDGRSSAAVAVALAMSLADQGTRVVVIDANTTDPQVHRLLRVSNLHGLADVVRDQTGIEEAVIDTSIPGLSVVPAGDWAAGPSSSAAHDLTKYFADLDQVADATVIASPPLLTATAGFVLAGEVGGVLLVATSGRTNRVDLTTCVDHLRLVDADVRGVVLATNGSVPSASGPTSAPSVT